MNADIIQDLKDMITNTIRMELSHFATKEDLKNFVTKEDLQDLATKEDLQDLKVDLEGKIDQLSSDVAEAISTSNNSTDAKLNDHEKRITGLELRAA